jgi:GNAT superfamily N-acetyltransferase
MAMEDGGFEVAKMAVAESERRQGVGRGLLEYAIEYARNHGIERLYLETNNTLANAIRLYEAVGFRHVPAGRVQPSPYVRANVYMEMTLGASI